MAISAYLPTVVYVVDNEYPITTKLYNGRKESKWYNSLRTKRIEEALDWEGGPSQEDAIRHDVLPVQGDIEPYFLKPGKEVFRPKKPNLHDMTPNVGNAYTRAEFMDIWTYLAKISLVDHDMFLQVLTLLYRNAYLMDHQETADGIRYLPSEDVLRTIDRIDGAVQEHLPDGGLMGFLAFCDLLAWNEEVKYHTEDGIPTFKGKFGAQVGRPSYFKTCIRVTYETSTFVWHSIEKADSPMEIEFKIIYSLMQQFARTRGTCQASNDQLVEWLHPYIYK